MRRAIIIGTAAMICLLATGCSLQSYVALPGGGARHDAAVDRAVRNAGDLAGRTAAAAGSEATGTRQDSSSSESSSPQPDSLVPDAQLKRNGSRVPPDLPPLREGDGHGVFLPNDEELGQRVAELGAYYLMGSYSTNFDHATPSQADNIALAAKRLNGQVVQPGAVFSYNQVAGPFTEEGGYGWGRMFVGNRIVPSVGGGVCQGASTLYNAVRIANLEVVERHQHGLTVPYLPPGQDATVTDSGGLNFRFRNDLDGPIVLRASAQGRWLTVGIYGPIQPPTVTWRHEVLSRTAKTTKQVTDKSLKPGERKTLAPGQDGVKVHTWITIHYPDGPVTKDLGIDNYRASPRVVGVGPQA